MGTIFQVNESNGNTTITGSLTMSSQQIHSVADPTVSTDAATKNYVDTIAQGITWKQAVQAATITVLPFTPTYSNGASGVGATLTAGSNGVLTIDGYTVLLNDRVLVQTQASAFQNGIYFVSTLGTGSVPYVLTRSLDYDTPADVVAGTATFVVNGTVNSDLGFVQTTAGTITIGTTALVFTQFTGLGDVVAGTGLTKSGNTISLITPVAVVNGGTGVSSWTNGQLLIGNTSGNTAALATLTGTTNEIIVTNGASSITLSTPQAIGTSSSPTFAGLTDTGITANKLVYTNGSQLLSAVTLGTGLSLTSGTLSSTVAPGGSTGDIQYNSSGAFAGAANITTDGTNLTLTSGTIFVNTVQAASGGLSLEPQTDSATGVVIKNAAGSTTLFQIDTTNTLSTLRFTNGGLEMRSGSNQSLIFNNAAGSTTYANLVADTTGFLKFTGSNDIMKVDMVNTTVVIGANALTEAASSILTLNSTTKGFLPPVMTTTQKNAISSPATGLIVYDSTLNFLQEWNGSAWTNVAPGAITSITGTANEVLVNGTTGSPQTGAITLTTPQAIGTASSPAFQNLTLGSTTAGGLILNDTEVTPKTITIEAPTTITASYTVKMPAAQGAASTSLQNDGSGNLSWTAAGGTGTITQNAYTVGTASGTYTGSTTLFNLPFTYTQDGKSLQVFYNGQVLVSGVDYTETSSTSVTMTNALVTGASVVFRYTTASTPANTSTAQYINYVVGTSSGTYTGSTTVYNLPFAYTQDGKSLWVYYDGVRLTPTDDYTETSSTSITTTQALLSGNKIAFSTISAAGTANSATFYRENYVVGTATGNYTGSTTVFNLVNTYVPGGTNLTVYLDGDLQTLGSTIDYLETNSSTVTFNNALITGQKVAFCFSQSTAAAGTISSGTANLLAYYPSSSSTIAGIAGNASAGSNKITNLANGTASTDAVAFGQIHYTQTPVQVRVTTSNTTTSNTLSNTSLAASITPSTSSSKIKITCNFSASNSSVAAESVWTILRGATNLATGNALGFAIDDQAVATDQSTYAFTFIDSPATTSSTTYTLAHRTSAGTLTTGGSADSIILLEEVI